MRKNPPRAYTSWRGMIDRCTNSNNTAYEHYGGRGIIVCVAWRSFDVFFADMGERPPKCSLERINNSLNYCPENCAWATQTTQTRNSRHNVYVTVRGRRMCLSEAAETLNISAAALYTRRSRLGQQNVDDYLVKVESYPRR